MQKIKLFWSSIVFLSSGALCGMHPLPTPTKVVSVEDLFFTDVNKVSDTCKIVSHGSLNQVEPDFKKVVPTKSLQLGAVIDKIKDQCKQYNKEYKPIIPLENLRMVVDSYKKSRESFLKDEKIILDENNDSYVEKVSPKGDYQAGVIGDLHGSVHSLIKNLGLLQKGGLLDKNYILKKNAYLFFLGDISDRGAYSTEAWYIILSLALNNREASGEERVHIIRGNHEEMTLGWRYGFADELDKKYPKEYLFKNFTRLFEVLPSAIYLNHIQLNHGGIPLTKTGKLNFPGLKRFLKESPKQNGLRIPTEIGRALRWGQIFETKKETKPAIDGQTAMDLLLDGNKPQNKKSYDVIHSEKAFETTRKNPLEETLESPTTNQQPKETKSSQSSTMNANRFFKMARNFKKEKEIFRSIALKLKKPSYKQQPLPKKTVKKRKKKKLSIEIPIPRITDIIEKKITHIYDETDKDNPILIARAGEKHPDVYDVNHAYIKKIYEGTGIQNVFSGHTHGKFAIKILGQNRNENCVMNRKRINLNTFSSCIFLSCPEYKGKTRFEGLGIIKAKGNYDNWVLYPLERYTTTSWLQKKIKTILRDFDNFNHDGKISRATKEEDLKIVEERLNKVERLRMPSRRIRNKIQELRKNLQNKRLTLNKNVKI